MKRYFTLLVAALLMIATTEAAEPNKFLKSGNDRFSIKVEPFIGAYLMKSGNMKDIDPNPPSGIHFGIEFPSEKYHDTDYSTSAANSARFTSEQPWVISTTVPVRR